MEGILKDFGAYIILVVFAGLGIYQYLRYKKGKITINVDKHNLIPGEAVKGIVNLQLNKDTSVNCFDISLLGQEVLSYRKRGRRKTKRNDIYKEKSSILRGKELMSGHKGEYNFNFIVPDPKKFLTLDFNKEQSFLSKALSFIRQEEKRVEWVISVVVDAKGIDLSENEQIFISL